jgi:hypothetical protein
MAMAPPFDVDHVGPDGLLAHRLDGHCGDERA